MSRGAALALLLLLAGCGATQGGPDAASAPARHTAAVVSGSAAPEDGAVVALVARRTRCTAEPPALLCTGALIAPDVVLTAAHCLEVLGEGGQYEVFVGERLLPLPEGRFHRVTQVRSHPGYVHATHARDVALLRLASPSAEPPLALPRPEELPGELPTPGLALRALGYGETRDAAAPAGLRRQGTLSVASVTEAAFVAQPSPAMSCTGDSGGPVLGSPAGREVLLGVTVSGDYACRAEAVQVRVDAVLQDFVQPFLQEGSPAAEPAPLAAAQLCAQPCERSAQCPAGLACEADASGVGRCMLLGLREGDFSAACSSDAACGEGGTCARLESEGADACRCFTACAAQEAPAEGGCAAASAAPCLLALLSLLGLGRRPGADGRSGAR